MAIETLRALFGRLIGRSGAVGDAAQSADAPTPHAQLLDSVVASLPDAAIVLDRGGRVMTFNAAARTIAPALTRGAQASLALRVPEVVEAVRVVVATNEPRSVEFAQRVPVDRWFMAHVRPLSGEGADLILLVFHDLTPLHRVEEMRADFVANASHELRTPLAALSGFIDTLLGSARDDVAARNRFLAIMKTQATRMARLIDDLLSLSRVELIEHMHPETPVDLVSIVRQVVDGLQTLATDRNVEIAIALPAEPAIVPGDRDELTRVFENLIENALKYGANGKRVDIGFSAATARGGEAETLVTVRDYGPGIAAEHIPRLTERFYRVDVTQSRAEGGTGLGLSLVKHILNRHRGRLAIESEAGNGATFTVRLPLIHTESAAAAQ
ncbi:MAG: two-component system, OmpR family, phosphate regulon sensor histidine kinase PhoR [Hyphomicrobiales bacterium]|jgi:two-component system phosphate regulon sensor histidine kinase PhoR|nr:two-component system, OmpR family, phosphate regulon sensor histidine kinase PhoR [Hyphomicrobiales bacterium]